MGTLKFKERDFRKLVAKARFSGRNTICEELPMSYAVGDYTRGKTFGLPDVFFDIVAFSESEEFHLAELKMIDAKDLWNGKFFGQLLWYNFLFRSEPWSELLGRFVMRAHQNVDLVHGDIGRIASHLANYGTGSSHQEGDRNAEFSSLSLVVCGGHGYELLLDFNPAAWSFYHEFNEILAANETEFDIFHAYIDGDDFVIRHITQCREVNDLTASAKSAYERFGSSTAG